MQEADLVEEVAAAFGHVVDGHIVKDSNQKSQGCVYDSFDYSYSITQKLSGRGELNGPRGISFSAVLLERIMFTCNLC